MIRHVLSSASHPSISRHVTRTALRSLVTKSPGPDPLELLRKECVHWKKCDTNGYRLPGVHWTFNIAIAPPVVHSDVSNMAPNLRTVGMQRVSPRGIDFVMKKGSKVAEALKVAEVPLAMLYSQGQYVPGDSAEQWRGEGFCETLALQEVLHILPHYTVTGMVASKRIEMESLQNNTSDSLHDHVSPDRLQAGNKSHLTEITQKARLELESDQISMDELEDCIQAFRFSPDRLERMSGGPDSIMWERWEWLRASSGDSPEGAIPWNQPKHLLPH